MDSIGGQFNRLITVERNLSALRYSIAKGFTDLDEDEMDSIFVKLDEIQSALELRVAKSLDSR